MVAGYLRAACCLGFALAWCGTAVIGFAQTWDGGGSNDNFTTAANWNPNVAPLNNGTANLIFGGTAGLTPVVNIDYDVESITFNNTADHFNIGQLNNSTLFVRGGGIINNDANSHIFGLPVDISRTATFTAFDANNGNLWFDESVRLGTKSLVVTGDFNTAFFDGIAGTGALVKAGTGVLYIAPTATNPYDLTVNAGTVFYAGNTTFDASATIAVNAGEMAVNGNLTLDGTQLTVASAALFDLDQNNLSGRLELTVQNGADATFQGFRLVSRELYRVTGASSTLTFGGLDLQNDSRLEVLAGAEANFSAGFFVGTNGDAASVLVDGVNSTLRLANSPALSALIGGGLTSSGSLTFRNGAVGDLANRTVQVSGGTQSDGTLNVESGAHVNLGALQVANQAFSEQTGTVTITGPGSTLTATSNTVAAEVGNTLDGSAVVRIENGAQLDVNSPLVIHETGAVHVTNGILSMKLGNTITNNGAFNFNSGRLNLGESLSIGGGTSLLGVNVNLGTGRTVSVPSTRTTSVAQPGVLVLDGGSLTTGALVNNGGTFDFRRGELSITGIGGLTIGSSGPLGAAISLGSGQTLNVTNEATVQNGASLLVETGGAFTAGTLSNNGAVVLDGANSTLGGDAMNNASLLRGDGRVTARVNNVATGEIRAEQNKTLQFTAPTGPNSGRITLQGGTLQFGSPLSNINSGVISGRGTLFFDGGLTNRARMQFSGGPTDIYGDVAFDGGAGGGELINSGGGNVVTLYGTVRHNGDEIRISPSCTTVFFGDVSGAGPFTGTGAVRFEGTFSPGNSPSIVTFAGDMELTSEATLIMELAGIVPGVGYDQLQVSGNLSLDGALEVNLLDGFVPQYGNTFNLLDFASLSGQFNELRLPALSNGLNWDTGLLYADGSISVVPEPSTAMLAALAAIAGLMASRRKEHKSILGR